MNSEKSEYTKGVAYAASAFLLWGILPLYWKMIKDVSPLEILAHRLIWTLAFMLIFVSIRGHWQSVRQIFKTRKTLLTLGLSSLLLGTNWFVYVLAVYSDRVIEASMGYYINPLVSVLLGVIFLKERLKFWQGVAVALAIAGVINIVLRYGQVPWISLILALSFGMYGLLRKTVDSDSPTGLLIESGLLSLIALTYMTVIGIRGDMAFGHTDWQTHLLFFGAGPLTALPVLWFAHGARRIPLSLVGFLQYLAPTCFLILGVFVFGEPFTLVHLLTFILIWAGILVYTVSTRLGRTPT